eukprot:scaffold9490_cov32-Cyclotella_meneghiniana.AAC.2
MPLATLDQTILDTARSVAKVTLKQWSEKEGCFLNVVMSAKADIENFLSSFSHLGIDGIIHHGKEADTFVVSFVSSNDWDVAVNTVCRTKNNGPVYGSHTVGSKRVKFRKMKSSSGESGTKRKSDEAHVTKLQSQAVEKDALVAELQGQIVQKDARIAELQCLEAQVAELQRQAEEKDALVAELQGQTQQKDARIAELQCLAAEKEARVIELQSKTESKEALVAELQWQTEQKVAHVAKLQCLAAEKEARIIELQRVAEEKDAHIAELQHIDDAKNARLKRYDESSIILEDKVKELDDKLKCSESDVKKLKQENNVLENKLECTRRKLESSHKDAEEIKKMAVEIANINTKMTKTARKKIALLSASSSATTSRSVSSEIPTVERRVAVQFEEGVFEGKITKVEAHWRIEILYDDEQTEETIFPDEGIKLLAAYEIYLCQIK